MSGADEFATRLQETFQEEAREHVEVLTAGLLSLEKGLASENRAAVLEQVFRAAHSLKGAARAADRKGIEAICQAAESILAGMRSGEVRPAAGRFDALLDAVNGVGELLRLGPGGKLPALPGILDALSAAETEGAAAGSGAAPHAPQTTRQEGGGIPPARDSLPGSVRIPVPTLDSLLRRADELVHVKSAFAWCTESLGSLVSDLEDRRSGASPQRLASLASKVRDALTHAETEQFQTAERIDLLLEELRKTFLLPCSTLLALLPKTIRDLSRDKGVAVDLEVHGEEVRVDKRVLDEVKDSLMHLVRNAVDHGIEPPESRRAAGKPGNGRIAVTVRQMGTNEVELIVSDDGQGIDAAAVRNAAVERGVVLRQEAEALSDAAAVDLIFRSDVSTSVEVTALSGRGIGLAIVRDAVERLSGNVTVHTQVGKGSSFRLLLPVARSTLRGVLVRAGDRLFVLPVADVRRAVRFPRAEVRALQNLPALMLEEGPVRLLRLGELLRIPAEKGAEERKFGLALLVRHRESTVALEVDEVVGEQEVLARPLGPQIARLGRVAGATVLATGELVPILNTPDLVRAAAAFRAAFRDEAVARRDAAAPRTILVVEDSITSRMLLKNILEAAGYAVKTAVDGVDALALLRTEELGLVVSDVDMPRMNGFVLTEKIRADPKLRDLPVILVTALEKREDRERGVDAGANAYIIKSGFDQASLLSAVERLL